MISYLSTIKDEILSLSSFLYNNPEESFSEHKACSYLVNLLKRNDFRVTENYLDMSTAFYAEYGQGHPKICYICEYDASPKDGHITGHNLVSAMSAGAALSLSKVLPKLQSGTVIILGCPGELTGSLKLTMSKQGTFQDVDVVLMAKPDVENAETGTSMALLPLKIKYTSDIGLINSHNGSYSSMDACNFTLNAISLLKAGFESECTIDSFVFKNVLCQNPPKESEINLYIRAPKMLQACVIEKKVKELVSVTASLMNLHYEISMPELPYDELIPNHTLSRIFAHNLKEVGIINTGKPKNAYDGLSIGTVSHLVPCLHGYISIVEDNSIKYSSCDFAKATISGYAQDSIIKAASTLAMTGLDLLEKEELLQEVKVEFYNILKDHKYTPCIE